MINTPVRFIYTPQTLTAVLFGLLIFRLLLLDRTKVVHKDESVLVFRVAVALSALVAGTEVALLRPSTNVLPRLTSVLAQLTEGS